MKMASASILVKSENPTITCDDPIPNMYNTLSERQLIKSEISDVRVNDIPHEYSAVIRTEAIDCTIADSQLIKTETPDLSENMALRDPAEWSSLIKEDEPIDLMENPGNVAHQTLNQTLKSVPVATVAESKVFDVFHRRFVCNWCDKRFSSSSYLAVHKRFHTGEKPFVCDVCDKSFPQSSALTTHKRSHTGEKPFLCNICEKRFAYSSSLTWHKRRTHTGEKPFVCGLCYKSFWHSSRLTRHKLLLHTEKPVSQ